MIGGTIAGRWVAFVALSLIAAVAIVAWPGGTQAQDREEPTKAEAMTSGLVTLGRGQVAKLNVVAVPRDVRGPAVCTGELAFIDADGSVVAHETVELQPQKAKSLSFDPAQMRDGGIPPDDGVEGDGGAEIRGGFQVADCPSEARQKLSFLPSLEIREAGRTVGALGSFVAAPRAPIEEANQW